jgi:Arc/MetJ-type ribon-helix-helix transcriptional regulator
MDDTVRLTIELPAELYRELERAVDLGEASDAGEIVKAALWRWQARHVEFTPSELAALRQLLDEAESEEDVPDVDVERMILEERARKGG